MIKYASANALRTITNEITIFHTHTQIHTMTNRAMPDQMIKYQIAPSCQNNLEIFVPCSHYKTCVPQVKTNMYIFMGGGLRGRSRKGVGLRKTFLYVTWLLSKVQLFLGYVLLKYIFLANWINFPQVPSFGFLAFLRISIIILHEIRWLVEGWKTV